MKRRGTGGLSSEDAALWEHVTRGVKRTSLRKQVHSHADTQLPVPTNCDPKPGRPPTEHSRKSRPVQAAPSNKLTAHPVASLEPRKVKRLARGRDEIDARLDLHGMRQAEAHAALRGFLHRAFQNGFRIVLVITGKGRPNALPPDTPFDIFDDRERGVLRRSVPVWLADPDLRSIVVGHTSASIKHGGDGAIYVQLRNRDKHRG